MTILLFGCLTLFSKKRKKTNFTFFRRTLFPLSFFPFKTFNVCQNKKEVFSSVFRRSWVFVNFFPECSCFCYVVKFFPTSFWAFVRCMNEKNKIFPIFDFRTFRHFAHFEDINRVFRLKPFLATKVTKHKGGTFDLSKTVHFVF